MPADRDSIAALEKWKFKEKCRSVRIEIDDGFGATCWFVELHRGKSTVHCSETNFITFDSVDPTWHEKDGDLYCCVERGDDMVGWPGLAETINRAIECAEKFWAIT